MIARATVPPEKVQGREYPTPFTHKWSMNWNVLLPSLRESHHLKRKTKNNASITNLHRTVKENNRINLRIVQNYSRIKVGTLVNYPKMVKSWRLNSLWITNRNQWSKRKDKSLQKTQKRQILLSIYFLYSKKLLKMLMMNKRRNLWKSSQIKS